MIAHAQSLRAVHRQLEKVKHSDDRHEAEAVAKLIYSVESVLIVIVD